MTQAEIDQRINELRDEGLTAEYYCGEGCGIKIAVAEETERGRFCRCGAMMYFRNHIKKTEVPLREKEFWKIPRR